MTILDQAARMGWHRSLLVASTLLGCSAPSAPQVERPRTNEQARSWEPREACRQRTWLRYQAIRARVAEHPGPRPSHSVYAGLSGDVERALLRLNGWPRDALWLIESPPVFVQCEDGWARLMDSGEGNGWVSAHKEMLRRLGVEVAWNDDLLLYEVARSTR